MVIHIRTAAENGVPLSPEQRLLHLQMALGTEGNVQLSSRQRDHLEGALRNAHRFFQIYSPVRKQVDETFQKLLTPLLRSNNPLLTCDGKFPIPQDHFHLPKSLDPEKKMTEELHGFGIETLSQLGEVYLGGKIKKPRVLILWIGDMEDTNNAAVDYLAILQNLALAAEIAPPPVRLLHAAAGGIQSETPLPFAFDYDPLEGPLFLYDWLLTGEDFQIEVASAQAFHFRAELAARPLFEREPNGFISVEDIEYLEAHSPRTRSEKEKRIFLEARSDYAMQAIDVALQEYLHTDPESAFVVVRKVGLMHIPYEMEIAATLPWSYAAVTSFEAVRELSR